MVKVAEALVVPAFATVIVAVPVFAICAAEMDALSRVFETYAVGSALPFHCTVDCDVNPEPMALSKNIPPPEVTCLGEMVVRTKAPEVPTVKLNCGDSPPLAPLSTVTSTLPAVMTSDAAICAVSTDEETKVVERGLPF